ncbi:MAG: sigma factor, partial [Verrucomicrobiota bacterium]
MPSTSRDQSAQADGQKEGGILAIFEAEESPLLRFAFSLTGRRAIAEEVVQEVFLQLHRHWDNVENPRAWLYRSVRNRSYNH